MRGARSWPGWRDLDLTLGLSAGWRSIGVAAAAGGAFGLWMAVADATLFRAAVPAVQQVLVRDWTIGERLLWFLPGAVKDELLLRLIGLTALVWLGVALSGRPGRSLQPVAIALVAAGLWPLSAWGYLAGLDWDALTVVRELTLHVAAGVLWGWLYCRHGWVAGVAGHCGAHLVLQPALTVLG